MVTAAVLGILGDALLRSIPWRLNFYLWTVALSGGLIVVTWARWLAIPKFMFLPSLFTLFIAWRDAPFLRVWDTLAVLAALAISMVQVHGVRLREASLLDFLAGAVAAGVSSAVGALIFLFREISWHEISSHRTARRAAAMTVGVLFSVPLVLVFGSLLTSADPVFDALAHSAIDWELESVASHLTLSGLVAWVTLGYFWGLAWRPPEARNLTGRQSPQARHTRSRHPARGADSCLSGFLGCASQIPLRR